MPAVAVVQRRPATGDRRLPPTRARKVREMLAFLPSLNDRCLCSMVLVSLVLDNEQGYTTTIAQLVVSNHSIPLYDT